MGRGTIAIALLLILGAACRSADSVPEPGAVLVDVKYAKGGTRPDELRVWVYDDGGRLWDGTRIPESGALASGGGLDLGTVLIQPGSIHGALRVHMRGLKAAARVSDGVLKIASPLGSKRTYELTLDGAGLDDGDGDDVPDVIDDCLMAANPEQGGCKVQNDAGTGGGNDATAGAADSNRDATRDADGTLCTSDGGCNRKQGALCAKNSECSSGACADGVCCANACTGPCRSCSQPTATGVCQNYAVGTDPEHECSNGATCNGAGACSAATTNLLQGQVCATSGQCKSGFCVDGVCCNDACNSACQNCSTGTCQSVKRMDDVPQCSGTRTCDSRGVCIAG